MSHLDHLAVALALQDAAPSIRGNILIWGEAAPPPAFEPLLRTGRSMGFNPVSLTLRDSTGRTPVEPAMRAQMGSASKTGCDTISANPTPAGIEEARSLLHPGDMLVLDGYGLTPYQWHMVSTHLAGDSARAKLKGCPLLLLVSSEQNPPPPILANALHLEVSEGAARKHAGLTPRKIVQTLNSRQFLAEWRRLHREAWAYIATNPASTLTPEQAFTPAGRRATPRAQNWALASAAWAACSLLGLDPKPMIASAVGPMAALRVLQFSKERNDFNAPWDIPELTGMPRPANIVALLRRYKTSRIAGRGHQHLARPPERKAPPELTGEQTL